MSLINIISVPTASGNKTIEIHNDDLTNLRWNVDVLVFSAFHNKYIAAPNTVIEALEKNRDIIIAEFADTPFIDLRNSFKPTTLSTLYNFPMQSDLMKAHKELDSITDKIYGYKGSDKEVDRVAFLFNLYKEKIQ